MYTFIGRDSWREKLPDFRLPREVIDFGNDEDVNILRGCMFYFEGQKDVKLSQIKAHFTEFAIQKLIHDGFIEIVKKDG